jgi:Mrp family chromosome partitioning ATPase
MEPIDFLGALRRSWRLLLALAVIGAVVAVLIPISAHKGKHAAVDPTPWTATAVVGAPPTALNTQVGGGVNGAQTLFYAQRTAVMEAALKGVHLNHVREAHVTSYLKASLDVPKGTGKREAENVSEVILTGVGRTSRAAVKLTNSYAKALGVALNNVATARDKATGKTVTTSGSKTGYVVVRPATKATKKGVHKSSGGPVKSRKLRGLIGLGVGVVLGAILVLLREVLNRRLRTAGRAEAHFGYPVVVEIPAELRAIGRPATKVDVVTSPQSPTAEAYRMLRMSVMFEGLASGVLASEDLSNLVGVGALIGSATNGADPEPEAPSDMLPVPLHHSRQVVMVVSASDEPTRPQVAANLAATYAEAGQRVVVIGTAELGAGPITGKGSTLTGEIRPEDVQVRLESSWVERVFRLNLRHFIENSGQLVTRMPAVLDATRPLVDVIIIEAPPMLAVHHVEALSQAVDVVLVVGECGTTTFDQAHRSGDLLRRMGAPVLGVVLTNVRLKPRDARQFPVLSQPALTGPTVLAKDAEGADREPSEVPSVPTQV